MITALARGESPAVLVRFRGKADLSAAFQIADRDARSIYVYDTLTRFADRAQNQARQILQSQFGLSEADHGYTVLWIDNSIAIANLSAPMLNSLESLANVDSIRVQREIPLPVEEGIQGGPALDGIESSVSHIKAPDVWALGYKGAGVVLANIDAGVRYTHAALVNQYRGNLGGGTFDHLYNWYDPYNHATVPRTTHDHGTHTMGTMVGDDGGTNQIGVSPQSQWINCIGFGQPNAGGTDAGILECGQWMLAPTNFAGTPSSADPTKRPDVVNNSWGDCGQTFDPWYDSVIDGWIASGIAPVFSNGNASNCGYPSNPPLNTVGNPARSGKVLGIGSTGTSNGQYASHSNKGPTDNPNPGLPNYPDPHGFANLKPNFMAPGVNIRSAYASSDTAYGLMSGTSMSAPAATGVIGLMWSAAPCLKGNYGRTGSILMETAVRIPVNTGSPSDGPGNIPNQATGWGEVDALAAVNTSIAFCATGVPPMVSKVFAPSQIMAGETSTLTITLGNSGQTTAAVLSATLTDTFPADLVVAAAPNGATTCTGGTVTASAGGSSVSLNSGASIPASGSCTVKVDVTSAADGNYINTIPAGALETDIGDSTFDATAALKVGFTFPEPYCPVNFPSAVEPISRVLFDGIDNPSSPAVGGTPALEDFTAVIGNVAPGQTLSMAVEGNTSGNYTTKIVVYVDWNQNNVFTDPGERYVIGNLVNSTGADGKQAVADITVPGFALGGDTRMRVIKKYNSEPDSCNTSGYGQAEDYTLTVAGGGGTTYTVTPSVGTGDGTITPDTDQTVNENDTIDFTLVADAGFHIDSVGGTCGGSLAGNIYTTDPVIADCTVIANFAVDAGNPNLVCESPNHPLDSSISGTYVKWETAEISDGTSIPGANFNPYGTSGKLAFYWPNSSSGNEGVATTAAGKDWLVLQNGDQVGPSSVYSHATGAAENWDPGADGYLGFKFDCTTAGICYGYAHITSTGPDGFPATLVEYCWDNAGDAVTIGGTSPPSSVSVTKEFTPDPVAINVDSIATVTLSNSGAVDAVLTAPLVDNLPADLTASAATTTCLISTGLTSVNAPAASVTLPAGATIPANGSCTIDITVQSAIAGSYVNTIGAGDLQTDQGSNGAEASATLIVTAPPADPIAVVTPATGFNFTVDQGDTGSDTLEIGNIGASDLTYAITESAISHANPPSYRTAAAAKQLGNLSGQSFELSSSRARGGPLTSGAFFPLAETMISQMADNSPGDEGVSCGQTDVSTADNSWWRRFYFSEHPQVGATTNITAVTISAGSSAVPGGLPSTINLYTIAHSTAVDTIPTNRLTLIGTANGVVINPSASVTIPVMGTVSDTAGLDLVVEWHTDGSPDGQFSPGANATPETHPSFISSVACVINEPTKTADIGFPDFHLTMVVTVDDSGAPPVDDCQNPTDIPWLSASPTSGTVAPGDTDDVTVTVDASTLAAGSYAANVCVATNDPTQLMITVPVSLTVESVFVTDGIFCSGFEDGEDGSCGPTPPSDVVTGMINLPLIDDIAGSAFDFVPGNLYAFDSGMIDDINLYELANGMNVYWYGNATPLAVGGVVSGGDFAVLQSGDVVGPGSTFSSTSKPMTHWLGGEDGYIGVAFENEDTGQLSYGYIHMTTTGPDGYPAQMLEYAYDNGGNAITIP